MNRPLRVLALAEFDPAGVVLSHRDALKLAGSDVEIKVALRDARTPRQMQADWIGNVWHGGKSGEATSTPRDRTDDLKLAVGWCDVVQLHPGITQDKNIDDASYFQPDRGWPVEIQNAIWRKPVVTFWHGSRRTWAAFAAPASRRSGLPLPTAASTLDYASILDATWLPPWLPDVYGRAMLRRDVDPLVVAHTPTDPGNCHTEQITGWIRRLYPGARLAFRHGVPHLDAIVAKLGANAGFDHMRGAFSVNALECCMLGLDTYCLLLPEYAETGYRQGLRGNPFPATVDSLFERLRESVADWQTTVVRQMYCASWFALNFGLRSTVDRLERFYRSVL